MTTYTAIADSEVSQDKPATQALFRKLRDNVLAMFEGATGAPRMTPAAIASYPFFVLTTAVAKTYNTASGPAQVEFTNEVIDKGGYWDNSSAPYCLFKPLSSGYYEIDMSLVVARAAADSQIYLRKNGNIIGQWTCLAGTGNMHRVLSTVAQMNGSSDYIDIAVYSDSGSVALPVDGVGQNYIKGKKIAE